MSATIATPEVVPAKPSTSTRRETLFRLLRSPTFDIAVAIILFWTFCAIFGYRIAPHDPLPDQRRAAETEFDLSVRHGSARPGRALPHDRGRTQHHAHRSGATLLAVTLGTAIGLMLGYFRGWFDETRVA